MLIDCPNCSAQYDVPESKVRPNLRLRCSACATEWLALQTPVDVDATEDGPAAVDHDAPHAGGHRSLDDEFGAPAGTASVLDRLKKPQSLSPADDLDEGTDEFELPPLSVPGFLTPGPRLAPESIPAHRSAPSGPALGWVVSIAILVGAGWAAVHWRTPIMHSWPPSSRAYAAIGLLHGATPEPE
jgi:predicted Zn finger-like uncharacterized protein